MSRVDVVLASVSGVAAFVITAALLGLAGDRKPIDRRKAR